MVCSDMYEAPAAMKTPSVPSVSTEDRLNALSPSLRKHFLESVQYNREMLEELAEI
jgi:hypothetical protein